jgi:hypothetical protein
MAKVAKDMGMWRSTVFMKHFKEASGVSLRAQKVPLLTTDMVRKHQ